MKKFLFTLFLLFSLTIHSQNRYGLHQTVFNAFVNHKFDSMPSWCLDTIEFIQTPSKDTLKKESQVLWTPMAWQILQSRYSFMEYQAFQIFWKAADNGDLMMYIAVFKNEQLTELEMLFLIIDDDQKIYKIVLVTD